VETLSPQITNRFLNPGRSLDLYSQSADDSAAIAYQCQIIDGGFI
jgi:hypothetical protein